MKTSKKKIDIERLVINIAIISNLIIWVIVILNLWLWHNTTVSAYVTGWNLCSIVMMVSVDIAGNKNFKRDMENYNWLFEHISELEMMDKNNKDVCDEEETK